MGGGAWCYRHGNVPKAVALRRPSVSLRRDKIDPDAAGVEYTESGMNVDAQGKHIKEKELPKRFGMDFRPGDQLFFESIREDAVSDSNLRQAALANTMENSATSFARRWRGSS